MSRRRPDGIASNQLQRVSRMPGVLRANAADPSADAAGSGDAVAPRRVDGVPLLERENAQLRRALVSRIAIEQAKGVLAERFSLDVDEAFQLLRRAARSNRMSIHALAAAVAPGRATPVEIEALLPGHVRPRAVPGKPPRLRDAG